MSILQKINGSVVNRSKYHFEIQPNLKLAGREGQEKPFGFQKEFDRWL